MGSKSSCHEAARRWYFLQEELVSPEASWEFYKGWEIFHIDIELQNLPSHLRYKIFDDICIDEYTQEIVPCEGGDCTQCTHVCCRNQSCMRHSSDDVSSDNASPTGKTCVGKNVDVGRQCSDSTDVLTVSKDILNDSDLQQTMHSPENAASASGSENSNDVQERCSVCERSPSCDIDDVDLDNLEFRANVCFYSAVEVNPEIEDVAEQRNYSSDCGDVSDELSFSKSLPDSSKDLPEWNYSAPDTGVCTGEGSDSDSERWPNSQSGHITQNSSSMKFTATEGRAFHRNRSRLSQSAPTSQSSWKDASKASHSELRTFPGDADGNSLFTPASSCSLSHRRQSTPSVPKPPVPACRTGRSRGTAHPQNRRSSWREEPGWIPNPLDSDSDQEEPGGLGIFPKSSKSSRQSRDDLPPTQSTRQSSSTKTEVLDIKRAVQLSERRRCNSEPSSRPWPMAAYSRLELGHSDHQDVDTLSSGPDTQSKHCSRTTWRMMTPIWRKSRPHTDDTKSQTEKGKPQTEKNKPQTEDGTTRSIPTEDEDADLEKELEWLVQDPESHCRQDLDSPEEDVNEVTPAGIPRCPPDRPTIDFSIRDSFLSSLSPLQGHRVHDRREEPDLDWLCEPEWNNAELELFWKVLRPHLDFLLHTGDFGDLPKPRVAVSRVDSSDHNMLDRCLLHVQRHIWKGNYRQAVADFRAVIRHFRSCAIKSKLIERGLKNDLEVLRVVFFRKKPSRYRLWI